MARASLRNNGYALVVADAAAQAVVANRLAVEHVSLQVADDEAMLDAIPHAGAVFLGSMTPEAAGDYLAGPSHVLPTGGAARFGAPLGVYDFLVRTSVLRYGRDALGAQAADITRLARVEGLEAHARAVERRLR
jgi:histidinol dehydrogenase